MDEREEIKQKVPIIDLVSETVALKKAGRNWRGLCPFHNEKSPSFTVSPERQIWHCFGCGKGGDVFTFLMELDHLEFPEALRLLANRAGVVLKGHPTGTKEQSLRDDLLKIHQLAQELYHYLLLKHAAGEAGRTYLRERGMSSKLIETFHLGYAPQSWDTLYQFLHKKKFSDYLLEQSGLVIKGNRGYYDRFRGRIMFPLKNYRGQTIAFAGRVIPSEAPQDMTKVGAKYINSPETPIYVKGDNLFGLDLSKESIRKVGYAVVVEGEFDMISSFASGVSSVVAIKGTALTENQIRLLKRFSDKLVLALDADSAGDAAARRGIEIADRLGMEIRVVSGMVGKDPDDMARTDPVHWKKLVETAVAYYDFLIDSACKRFDAADPYGKKKITDEVLPSLARIQNTILQAHYVKLLSGKIGISEEKLTQALARKAPERITSADAPKDTDTRHLLEKSEEYLLAMLVQSSNFSASLNYISEQIDPSDLSQPAVSRIMMHLLDSHLALPQGTLNEYVQTLPSELVPTLDRVMLLDLSGLTDPVMFETELKKTVFQVKEKLLRRKISTISTQMHQAQESENETLLTALSHEQAQVREALKKLTQ